MIILKILVLVMLLLVVPFLVGLVPSHFLTPDMKTPGSILIMGYLLMLATLEVVGIPITLLFVYNAYYILITVFGICLLLWSALGIVLERKHLLKALKSEYIIPKISFIKTSSIESKVYWGLIGAVFVLQIVMVFVLASMDADDFFFNSQALSAQSYGTLYRMSSDTGRTMPLDIRHGMALFPIFQAFVSSLSGIHVAIVSHKVMPLILIPLSYLLVFKTGRVLFPQKKEAQYLFLLLMNVWRIFGYVSYYTSETFFLLRTWQGKSFAGNFIFPAVIWLFLVRYEKNLESNKWFYISLLLAVMAGGSGSSLAVLLTCGLIALMSLLFLLRRRNLKNFLLELLTCVPGLIYIVVYVLA